MILDGSDQDFNIVLMRSPNVFGIFTVHFSRFLAEIHYFDQSSYAPVYDFSKNTLLLERYPCIFSIRSCFARFDHVLGHCLWYFGISLMYFW